MVGAVLLLNEPSAFAIAVDLTTTATPSAPAGMPISDIAHLASIPGASGTPTGSIRFDAYKPFDPSCTFSPEFTQFVTVNGYGDYPSPAFNPTFGGLYHWTATYSGDGTFDTTSTACGDANESTDVAFATPTVTTQASPAAAGNPLTDTATVSGGLNPFGNVTFTLYDDPSCLGPAVFTSSPVPLSGGTATSDPPYFASANTTYFWTAQYSGDPANNGVITPCGDANETVTVALGAPTLTTRVTAATVVLGANTIADRATITGLAGASPGGTITFDMFGPGNPSCAFNDGGSADFTSTVTVTGNGTYRSGRFTPPSDGTYRWVATYSGDAGNLATSTACGDPGETTVVTPQFSTAASSGGLLGTAVNDVANLSGTIGGGGGGTIAFQLYGPNDPTCTNPPVFTSTRGVEGDGTYNSGGFTPSAEGTYQWVAQYSGDTRDNPPAATTCGDSAEQVTIALNVPSLTTTAFGASGVLAGSTIDDTATISGTVGGQGTITFTLFGPNNATCSGVPAFTSSPVSIDGDGNYSSDGFSANDAGTYRWVAAYSGDATDAPVTTACNDPNETVIVEATTPNLATAASYDGAQISDTASLTSPDSNFGTAPTGTITFRIYGPGDTTCAAPVSTSTVAVDAGYSDYTSAGFSPTSLGTYRVIATYNGDANNNPISGACLDANESVSVNSILPTITTQASGPTTLGATFSDAAVLSGGSSPTGTMTFAVFGPNDNTGCDVTPTFTATVAVNGAGTYTSPAFTPVALGVYNIVASYSGDAGNSPVKTACDDPAETVVVGPAQPTISTTASPSVPVQGNLSDAATLPGAFNPTGSVTFALFGPNDPTCTGTAVFTSTVPVGTGAITSAPFTTVEGGVGTYHWIASYSGDANNAPAAGACGDPNETVVVTKAVPIFTAQASGDTVAGAPITDTAILGGTDPATGTITFSLFGPNDATCATAPDVHLDRPRQR